jgi:hypothetical protein
MVSYFLFEPHLVLNFSDYLRINKIVSASSLFNALDKGMVDEAFYHLFPSSTFLSALSKDLLHHFCLQSVRQKTQNLDHL